MNILMVAAENDALTGCKVGGIGDVIRDIPAALNRQGCTVSVVTPSYGFLHKTAPAEQTGSVHFRFSGRVEYADLYQVRPRSGAFESAAHYVIDHPLFLNYNAEKNKNEIYSNDPPGRPFATDAVKFACFSAATAAAAAKGLFGRLDILHLHDWHAAFLLILRNFAPEGEPLRALRTVYTIHNLALQGVRPLSGDPSSLENWYPHINFGKQIPADLIDPRWTDCINPMAAGIRLADAVHAVSPSYAEEILQPSRPPEFYGGEGLEADLQRAQTEHRLHGILNGCEYPESEPAKQSVAGLIEALRAETAGQLAKRSTLSFSDLVTFQRLEKLRSARRKPQLIAVGISRIVDQKMLLMQAKGPDGTSGLERILKTIGPKGLCVLLGTGNPELERFLTEQAARHDNLLFLNFYSGRAAQKLYASGDLFLMPSSFEPCGIGQMLAMREGQPCLVHRTGGLRDTVEPGVNGFGFEGDTLEEQVDAMIAALHEAVTLRSKDPDAWQRIRSAAAATRFDWADSARRYINTLYKPVPGTDA